MSAADAAFDAFFARCSGGRSPYAYQQAVAARLFGGAHVDVWAPTGAGKTLSVLAPFLWQFAQSGRPRWDRLIYVLPLRSLVESIAAEARSIVAGLGIFTQDVDDMVRVQTGQRSDDAFFHEGRIILTTYDQLLSGALEGPYGLPDMLHNINTAAVAGALVVFDEYHLMQPNRAFLTAVAHLNQYQSFCQSVWMTATATSPLRKTLSKALNAVATDVSEAELAQIPAVDKVTRRIAMQETPISAAAVLDVHRSRSIALVNTVARANDLYDEIVAELDRRDQRDEVVLLHSRFIPFDRQRIEERVRALFGQKSEARCILVCTQVIEAGMNISAETLHTDVAPMSALVQRAGRCARFPGETGEVHVYPLPESTKRWWLPYDQTHVEHSQAALTPRTGARLDPTTMRELVDAAHAETDTALLRDGWRRRQTDITTRTHATVTLRQSEPISDLIRGDDGQSVRVVIAEDPAAGTLNPYAVEGFSLSRWALMSLFDLEARPIGWRWNPSDEREWTPLAGPDDLKQAFVVCLHPGVATYTSAGGLRVGQPGTWQSPPRPPRRRKKTGPYHQEPWSRHAREVGAEAVAQAGRGGAVLFDGLRGERWQISEAQVLAAARAVGLLHDVGKLQRGWQTWAERAQKSLDPTYVHRVPLAHTDFDRDNPADRERERVVNEGGRKPPHAAASAWYSVRAVVSLLREAPEAPTPELRAACLAAILSHHGGWISRAGGGGLGLQPLVADADTALAEAAGRSDITVLAPSKDARAPVDVLDGLLKPATGATVWPKWAPIMAYLVRTLRIADQRATSLYGGDN